MHDFSLFRYNRGVVMDALRAMGRADGAIGRRKAPIGRPEGVVHHSKIKLALNSMIQNAKRMLFERKLLYDDVSIIRA